MTLIWHLVRKDLHRLRLPVMLLSLLTFGKLVFFAMIGGAFSAPELTWLNRLQNGPELVLRILAEPIITYLLVGWLVFEDSPVEKDAHWITRPISGSQLFGAKLAGAVLLFVVLPLVLHAVWWLTCGLSGGEMALAVIELVTLQSLLVALALACASLTDAFPRFILWSLLVAGTVAIVQGVFAPLGRGGPGIGVSRLIALGLAGGLVALAITLHQFVTGRHRRSLVLATAAFVVVEAVGIGWPWDLTKIRELSATRPADRSAAVQLRIVGPTRLRQSGARQFAEMTLQLTGLPTGASVGRIRAAAEWSLDGTKAWNSRVSSTSSALTMDAIQRLLFPKPAAQVEAQTTLSLPFSPQIAKQAAHKPMALRTTLNLEVFRGQVLEELHLREQAAPREARAYTLSSLVSAPLNERRARNAATEGENTSQNAVSFVLTERSVEGLLPSGFRTSAYTVYALVNRGKGQFFLTDSLRSGPMAITTLNQARIACRRLTFLCGTDAVRVEDLVLAVIRFGDSESLTRAIDTNPVLLADGQYGARD